MRKITVYSTVGSIKNSYDTEITSWGELKDLILVDFEDLQLNKMVAMDNITKASYEHPEAILPTTDFIMFLYVKDTDKGLDNVPTDMKEIRALIADLKVTYGSTFTNHIGNYTRMPKADVIAKLQSFVPTVSETNTETKTEESKPSDSLVEKVESSQQVDPVTFISTTLTELKNCLSLGLTAITSIEEAMKTIEISVETRKEIDAEIENLKVEAARLVSYKF